MAYRNQRKQRLHVAELHKRQRKYPRIFKIKAPEIYAVDEHHRPGFFKRIALFMRMTSKILF